MPRKKTERIFDEKKIGENIKILRLQRGLSQTELSKQIGISQGHLSNMELGRGTITLNSVIRIAECFNVDLHVLIEGYANNYGKRYHCLQDIPDWEYRATIKLLMDNGIIDSADGHLNLSYDMIKMLVINYRAGVYKLN